MSLINQMLKDLEQRRPNSVENPTLIEDVRVVGTPNQKTKLPLILGMGLMAMAAAYFEQNPSLFRGQITLSNPVMTDVQAKSIETPAPIVPKNNASETQETLANAPESRVAFDPILTTMLTDESLNRLSMIKPLQTEQITAKATPASLPFISDAAPQVQSLKNELKDDAPKTEATRAEKQESESASLQLASKTNDARISKKVAPAQKIANDYRQALDYLQMGRVAEAQALLAQVLEAKPDHQDVRQTLASVLLDNKRKQEAMVVIKEGLDLNPAWTEFRVAFARLQFEANQSKEALVTMESGLSYAQNNAEYHGFLAVLLQRNERHQEAVEHYTKALAGNGSMASWLIGLGVSLQTLARYPEAQQAFERAQATSLTPELAQFVQQRLKQIKQLVS